MKKVCILLLFVLVFLTGCSNYNSQPDKLAEEMVKRISKGDYKNIDELILKEGKVIITEEGFKDYLKEKDVFIEGNKLVEVVDYEAPSDMVEYSNVTVRIDNNKTVEVNLRKKDGLWYVDLGESNYEQLEFLAPLDSTVKLNGKELAANIYSEKVQRNFELSYTSERAKPYLNKFVIKVLGDKEHELSVSKKGFENYSTKINSQTNGMENYGVRDSEKIFTVILTPSGDEKTKVEKFIKEYFDGVFSSINNSGTIEDLEKFIADGEFANFKNDFKGSYDGKIKALKKENSYSREVHEQYAYKNVEPFRDGIYYLDDNNVIYSGMLEYTYHYKFEYFGMMSSFADTNNKDEIVTKKTKLGVILVKDKNGYKVKDGDYLIP